MLRQLPRRKQSLVLDPMERLEVLPEDLTLRQPRASVAVIVNLDAQLDVNGLQHVQGQWLGLPVASGDVVDSVDGLLVPALREEVAGGFGHLEDECSDEGED